MTNIDQFESVFKAADKPVFEPESLDFNRLLIVTDLQQDAAEQFCGQVRTLLRTLDEPDASWQVLTGDQYGTVGELLQKVGESRCDMVCMYRNLHEPAREYPYSLGVFVDVLTQVTALPVLLMPHPGHLEDMAPLEAADTIMAITDHLTGDHHLVSFAARCTPDDGRLLLTHVEDKASFERFMGVIGRVPSIDTDDARQSILERLLKEPDDYIDSASTVLHDTRPSLRIEKIVALGHHLTDYRQLIAEHDVDLLVLNTKDDDQLAMHGLAYPLAVELRKTPMLLL